MRLGAAQSSRPQPLAAGIDPRSAIELAWNVKNRIVKSVFSLSQFLAQFAMSALGNSRTGRHNLHLE